MKEDGNISEQYEIENEDESWNAFRDRYLEVRPEIALEVSTTGKYVARLLKDMGFHVHIADPVKLSLIFNTTKKNDREDPINLQRSSGSVNCLRCIFHQGNQTISVLS